MVTGAEPTTSREDAHLDAAAAASGGAGAVRGLVLKSLVVLAGALLIKRLRKSTTRWDHAHSVASALSGEKAFCRTPQKPFRQRFYMVKPCPKEMKCAVELSSYAIRDVEEYKNFCDRPRDQRPQPEEVIGDIGEHLTTIHLSRCERGKRCLYEGSTPPGGFPSSWNGATYCTADLTILRNGEIHTWDRGYDAEGKQVWGPKVGPYEFKPAKGSSYDDMFLPLNLPRILSLEKKADDSSVLNEQ